MIVHLIYNVKGYIITEKLANMTVLLPHYILESGCNLLEVALSVEYIGDVLLFPRE